MCITCDFTFDQYKFLENINLGMTGYTFNYCKKRMDLNNKKSQKPKSSRMCISH